MSNGQGQGGGKPPQDDRTLLDPLSNDELRALREARQRMQAKKEPPSAVAHQIVIGPDSGEDIGDAPTRAVPALPSFDDDHISIDMISAPPAPAAPVPVAPSRASELPAPAPAWESGPDLSSAPEPPQQRVTGMVQDPATIPSSPPGGMGPTPSDPMSVMSQADTVALDHRQTGLPPSSGPNANQTATPGQPGFGENTLLWMQPPKQPPMPQTGSHNIADFLPRASRREVNEGRIKTIAAAVVGGLLLASLLYLILFTAPKGVIELRSQPNGAQVFIDGANYGQTPVKLTLSEGSYRISLRAAGFETSWFTANVKGEQTEQRDINLVPISRPGLMTVKIEVQPVASRISVDGKVYDGQRLLMVPNMDPLKRHKIVIESPGFVKVIQDVRADELKSSYSFVLAKSSK